MQRIIIVICLIVILGGTSTAFAATVLFCPMNSLDGWTVRSFGSAQTAIVAKGDSGKCTQVSTRQGTAFLTRDIPLDEVRGSRLEVGCLVRCEELVPGIQLTSTAKIHLAVKTPDGVRQHSARFSDSESWQFQGFTADIPQSAERVVLNLGLEACSGTVQFDQLVVRTDQRTVIPLDLSAAANASHKQLGIDVFPKGDVLWNEIPFTILDGTRNDGADCIRLKGVDHEDWPERITPPIPVGRAASTIYFLHATLIQRETVETPCAMWSVWFSGGHNSSLSVFEGRDIGSVRTEDNLENWQIAWQGKDASDTEIAFGVTKWSVYMSAPVIHLTARSYRGAAPVILAITLVEQPPEPGPEMDDSEGEGGVDFSE